MNEKHIADLSATLDRIVKIKTLTPDLVDVFLQLLSEVAYRELWSDEAGCRFVEHCLDELHCFFGKLERKGVGHLIGRSFSQFTTTMSAFLVVWKLNPKSHLAKSIGSAWMNCVPMSPEVRWTAIKDNVVHFRNLFHILRNVGNIFVQMDIFELLMRYFYQLKSHYNIKSLLDLDPHWATEADGKMLCHFFNTMIGDMDLEAVQFLNYFNRNTVDIRVATFVAQRIFLNRNMLPVKIPMVYDKPIEFNVNFNLGVKSVSFYTAIGTFDQSAAEASAWLPCEIFIESMKRVVYSIENKDFTVHFKLNEEVQLYPNFQCQYLFMVFGIDCLNDMRKYVFEQFHVQKARVKSFDEPSIRSTCFADSSITQPMNGFPPQNPQPASLSCLQSATINVVASSKHAMPPPAISPTIHYIGSENTENTMEEICQAFDGLNPSQDEKLSKSPFYTGSTVPFPSGIPQAPVESIKQNITQSITSSDASNVSQVSRRSVRSIRVMQELRSLRKPYDSSPVETNPQTDPYHLKNMANDIHCTSPPAKNRSKVSKTTTNKSSVRANARFKNPYLRFKSSQKKPIEAEDNKLVNFSYRRKNNTQLGYTTQEVSIQFCDEVQPAGAATTTTKLTKRQMAATAKKAAHDEKNRNEATSKKAKAKKGSKVTGSLHAKRMSVARTKEVITISTPTSATIAQTDTCSKTVSTMEIETCDQPPTIDSDGSNQGMVSPVMMSRSKPRNNTNKTFDYLELVSKEKEKIYKPLPIPTVVSICGVAAIHHQSVQGDPGSPPDFCRSANLSVPSISIPSIEQDNFSGNNTSNHIRPVFQFLEIPPTPSPPPHHHSLSIEEIPKSIEHSAKIPRNIPNRSISTSSIPDDTPRKSHQTVPRRSILKKTAHTNNNSFQEQHMDMSKTATAMKRIALEAELVKITPKRGRSSQPPLPNMREYDNNWILRNFVETLDVGNGLCEEDVLERTVDSCNISSPIRANVRSEYEPLEWQSDAGSSCNNDSSKENYYPQVAHCTATSRGPLLEKVQQCIHPLEVECSLPKKSNNISARRVSFSMDTTSAADVSNQSDTNPDPEGIADPTLRQLLADQSKMRSEQRDPQRVQLQQQLDKFQQELNGLIEQGVIRMGWTDDRRRTIQKLTIELEKERSAYDAAIKDSNEYCSTALEKLSKLNDRLTELNQRAEQMGQLMENETEHFGRTVWSAAVKKTYQKFRSVLDQMGNSS